MKDNVPAACRIKVTLRDIRPPIWRRLEIGTGVTFRGLHHILQAAFGWTDSHLHVFNVGALRIGIPDPEWPEDVSERGVSLRDALRQGVRRWKPALGVDGSCTLRTTSRTIWSDHEDHHSQ